MWRISCSLWLKKFAPSSQRWVSWIVLAGPDGMGLASIKAPRFWWFVIKAHLILVWFKSQVVVFALVMWIYISFWVAALKLANGHQLGLLLKLPIGDWISTSRLIPSVLVNHPSCPVALSFFSIWISIQEAKSTCLLTKSHFLVIRTSKSPFFF